MFNFQTFKHKGDDELKIRWQERFEASKHQYQIVHWRNERHFESAHLRFISWGIGHLQGTIAESMQHS